MRVLVYLFKFAVFSFMVPLNAGGTSWSELLQRADSLAEAQNPDSAIVLGERALKRAETEFGPEDTVVARVLHHLGNYSYQKADYNESELRWRRALAIRENTLGSEHPDVAKSLSNLGIINEMQGRYAEAEPLYLRSLEIWERAYGPDHPDVAIALNNLGILYWVQGKYRQAEPLYWRALAIRKKALGPNHLDVALSLDNLAVLYNVQGKYYEAEPICRQALAIMERNLGPDHQLVAGTLDNLANLCFQQGNYADAEPLYKRGLAIAERTLGPNHPDVASHLNNLANLYDEQGKYSDAEPLYNRVLTITEKALGPDHPGVAAGLINLGILYRNQGKYAQAEPLYRRALAIGEKALGPDHPDVAARLTNLGILCVHLGSNAEAESLYQRALNIEEKVLGPEHPDVAKSLHCLANLYQDQARYAEADSLYQQALNIRVKALGNNHRFVAETLESYSRLYRRQKRHVKALALAEQASSIRHKNFVDNAYALSEKDALVYSHGLRNSVDNFLSCYVELDSDVLQSVVTAADIILSSKGQVSDGIFEQRQALVSETDSTTLSLAESLRLTKFQLSHFFVEGPDEDVDAYRNEVDSLAKLANKLEADLSRRGTSFTRHQNYTNISVDRIKAHLPENSVLVEYLRYNYLQLKPDSSIPHYLTVVIDGDGEVVITELGMASEIDPLIREYREHMLRVSRADKVPTVVDQEDYERISRQLYHRIWLPIEKKLMGKELVFIAPDGALNIVSFAGLIDLHGQYLVEDLAIHYLSSGRDLIRLKDVPEPSNGLIALGDPDFDAPASIRLAGTPLPEDIAIEPVYYATRNIRSGCGSLKDLAVDPLPGTRTEVEKIVSQWKVYANEPSLFHLGPDASEDNFKARAPGRRVIHLATHGYFLEGSCQPKLARRNVDSDVGFVGENPLLLSGLFLAGANLHGEGADSVGVEDGILTAYEVSAMDLEGTELVILSACETGLGEVKEGEGVYGLRRAFQVAGARTVISALWPVSDQATAEMMGLLYDKGHEPLPQTIRNIQLRTIDELRAGSNVDHPFTWGAFIALGDWR